MDEKILKKNVVSLSQYNPFCIEQLQKIDFSNIKQEEETCKNGMKTLILYKDSKKYFLHSKYNPDTEAKRIVEKIDFSKDSLIIVFGLGLAYHLFELKKNISKDTRVMIVEHNKEILKYTLANVDLSEIFNTPQFILLFGEQEEIGKLIASHMGLNFYNIAYNIQTIELPNYHIYNKENVWVMKRIVQGLSSAIISYGNSLEDMFVGFRNNYENIDAIMESNSINEVRDKYKNIPAIIVASGPSLDKNIHYLKEAYGKALIIACDASVRACEKQRVKIDAVASIERDEPTYTYYYKDREFDEDLVLVGPGLLWPKIYEEYKGKTIIMSKHFEGPEAWWHNHFNNIEFVNQGQSSATVAFAVAKEAGCNPIILIGQDLAYTDKRKHSELTHVEQEGANNDEESDDVYLEDYEGNLIRSHWVYKIFRDWYEHQIMLYPDLKVIDATEGGAYIHGSTVMTLKKAIDTYCTMPIEKHLIGYLKDVVIEDTEKIKKYIEIIEDIIKQIKSLGNIRKEAEKHYEVLLNIEKKHNIPCCNEKELIDIVKKMQKGDTIIQHILNENSSIKSYYHQIIIQTIIYVKKIGNTLNNESVERNHLLQKNLMYIIKDSSKLIIEEYEKAKEYIESKKNALEKKTERVG